MTGHLFELDVVRLITFGAVIAVHSLAFTESPDNRLVAGAMMLLQFGREVFFTLTGFVLVYSQRNRPGRSAHFWGRRILLVAVPYVIWSAIYFGYSVLGPSHLHPSVAAFATDLLYGGAMYHLYFLLVTLQLYVVLPALIAFVERTASRAAFVLIPVAAANLAWLAVLQWVKAPAGGAGWWWVHAYELLPTYSMYVLAGCYAAVHLSALQRFVDRNRARLLLVSLLCAAGAIGAYVAQLREFSPRSAASVLQPATTLSCAAALICLYPIGSRWARGPRRHASAVLVLSDVSFGVYLSHPLWLQIVLDHGLGNAHQAVPPVLATALGFAVAVAGGVTLSLLVRSTPLSIPLTGRASSPRRAGTLLSRSSASLTHRLMFRRDIPVHELPTRADREAIDVRSGGPHRRHQRRVDPVA